MSVTGVFVLRYKMKKNGEKFSHTFGYPFVPIFFILVEGCMMVYVFFNKPVQSLIGIGITLVGLIVYFLLIKSKRNVVL
jgi:basic amino acid/polyamine antiporter, APA family